MMEPAWYEEETSEESDVEEPLEYDLTATPNDFNTRTIFDYLNSDVIVIPGFQRNFVWDIKRASKLIESLIIGLPVPQLFLYEESRNKFLVIDGQQRLMSIYYFFHRRFPLMDKRGQLRRLTELENRHTPESFLHSDEYFTGFNLKLPSRVQHQPNRLDGLNYSSLLPEHRTAFDLRPIRNVVVKQTGPNPNDLAMYEIFNRLNSGGMLLTPQEIRSSLYHSPFYEMLFGLNMNEKWRRFVGLSEPDIHLKDIEYLLRAFAMLIDGSDYNPSMIKFLNAFSKRAKSFPDVVVSNCQRQFETFLTACDRLDEKIFRTQTNRFSITIFESVFRAVVRKQASDPGLAPGHVDSQSILELKQKADFSAAASRATTNTANVEARLRLAEETVRVVN